MVIQWLEGVSPLFETESAIMPDVGSLVRIPAPGDLNNRLMEVVSAVHVVKNSSGRFKLHQGVVQLKERLEP